MLWTNYNITIPPVLLHSDEEDGTEGKKDKDEGKNNDPSKRQPFATLFPLLFFNRSFCCLTNEKCEASRPLSFGRSIQVFFSSLTLALPFNGSPEAYYMSYLRKMFSVFWHSNKKPTKLNSLVISCFLIMAIIHNFC